MASAVYDDPAGWAHSAALPHAFADAGVTIKDTWHTLGMRSTGSHDVMIEGVFVPESAVGLRRPQGLWHPFFIVVTTVAFPLIMAVYVGVAEAAHALALERAHRKQDDPQTAYLIGEMTNALVTAQMALQGMIAITDNYDFEPVDATANAIFIRKTILARAAITTVEKAMEVVGGSAVVPQRGARAPVPRCPGWSLPSVTRKAAAPLYRAYGARSRACWEQDGVREWQVIRDSATGSEGGVTRCSHGHTPSIGFWRVRPDQPGHRHSETAPDTPSLISLLPLCAWGCGISYKGRFFVSPCISGGS